MTPMLRLAVWLCGLAVPVFPQCTKAKTSCTEKLALGAEGRYSIVYRSFPLRQKNAKIRRALIVVHGAGRNADGYFASAVAGALIAGALEDTVVVSPRIASNTGADCKDALDPGEISWTCGGAPDWRRGGTGQGLSVTTFDFVDEIVRKVTNKNTFPNLRTVVITGHSAGGQFTNRYAAANKVHDKAGVPIRYVVANPSSYLYLDDRRLASGSCSVDGKCTGEFQPFSDENKCGGFDSWHYGLKDRAGYAAPISDEDLRKNLIARDVVYLLGELDTLPIGGFDGSCPAMAQGPTRLARGLNYWSYMRSGYGARHKLVLVPFCGHNGRCMYTADQAMPVLFPAAR
jgi:hypothetical protein